MTSLPVATQLTPDFTLKVNAQDVTFDIRDRLLSLTLTDNRGFEVDELKIELDDADGQLALPPRGAVLSLSLGWKDSALEDKGEFTVDEITHHGAPDQLTIIARSADLRGPLNVQREASYHDTTLGNVVKALAARNKLTPVLAEGFAEIAIAHIDQTKESDAAFMTRLASRYGAVAVIKAGKLLFIRPGNGVNASGKPLPPLTLTRQDGDQHSFNIPDRDAYTGVKANWLHTKKAMPNCVTLQRTVKPACSPAPQHPAAQKKSGAAGASECEQGEYLAGRKDNVLTLPTTYPTEAAAMQAAKAEWERLQRTVVTFKLKLALGRADLMPETPVRVRGFKSVIDSRLWIISKLTHTVDSAGFTTALEFELPLKGMEYKADYENENSQ
jgi:phage protein D